MDIFAVITLLGGLALFLYGMEIMGSGLNKSSGAALKKVLEKVTRSALTGLLTGLLVTAVIQSSTATIVLTVGLMSAGMLNLRQAVSVVLGANIGTTVTAQIIRLMDIDSTGNMILEIFKPSTLAPVALVVGIILVMFIKRGNSRVLGEIFLGFGALFTGLLTMTSAVGPLSGSPMFLGLLSRFSEIPVLGILAGLVLTVIVQSSSAMVGMLQALSSTGVMTFNLVYPIIMGINLGTCVTTAIVCSIGSSKDAKRVGLAHILFNCVGTVLFMAVMSIIKRSGGLPELWPNIVNSGGIANFQTLFNLITAVVLLPFTNQLVKLSKLIIKPDAHPTLIPELHTPDEKLFLSPVLALADAEKSIAAMGAMARENLISAKSQLTAYSPALAEDILAREDRLDRFADDSDNFFIRLSRHIDTEDDNMHISLLMQTVPCFERIGDYATNIDELALRLVKERLTFSPVAVAELNVLGSAVDEVTEMTVRAFATTDLSLAGRIEPLEEVVDDMVGLLRERHTERLKTGSCTVSAGLVFMEAMTYLERAADQCSSIALLLLARENEDVMKNHHEYLRELHRGGDTEYSDALRQLREKYVTPLVKIGEGQLD